jgi:hypothetical protein
LESVQQRVSLLGLGRPHGNQLRSWVLTVEMGTSFTCPPSHAVVLQTPVPVPGQHYQIRISPQTGEEIEAGRGSVTGPAPYSDQYGTQIHSLRPLWPH